MNSGERIHQSERAGCGCRESGGDANAVHVNLAAQRVTGPCGKRLVLTNLEGIPRLYYTVKLRVDNEHKGLNRVAARIDGLHRVDDSERCHHIGRNGGYISAWCRYSVQLVYQAVATVFPYVWLVLTYLVVHGGHTVLRIDNPLACDDRVATAGSRHRVEQRIGGRFGCRVSSHAGQLDLVTAEYAINLVVKRVVQRVVGPLKRLVLTNGERCSRLHHIIALVYT